MHGIYKGNIDCMVGHGALVREPSLGEKAKSDKSDLIMAQFDDRERWGKELPSLALGWHAFERSDFTIDTPTPEPQTGRSIMDAHEKLLDDMAERRNQVFKQMYMNGPPKWATNGPTGRRIAPPPTQQPGNLKIYPTQPDFGKPDPKYDALPDDPRLTPQQRADILKGLADGFTDAGIVKDIDDGVTWRNPNPGTFKVQVIHDEVLYTDIEAEEIYVDNKRNAVVWDRKRYVK